MDANSYAGLSNSQAGSQDNFSSDEKHVILEDEFSVASLLNNVKITMDSFDNRP